MSLLNLGWFVLDKVDLKLALLIAQTGFLGEAWRRRTQTRRCEYDATIQAAVAAVSRLAAGNEQIKYCRLPRRWRKRFRAHADVFL